MTYTYPDPRNLALPGDRARCGCHIEWETGALVMCEPHEEQAEIDAHVRWAKSMEAEFRQHWDADVEALADHFERRAS